MKQFILSILCLFTFCFCSDIDKYMDKAEEARNSLNYTDAIYYYEKVLSLDENNIWAKRQLGYIYILSMPTQVKLLKATEYLFSIDEDYYPKDYLLLGIGLFKVRTFFIENDETYQQMLNASIENLSDFLEIYESAEEVFSIDELEEWKRAFGLNHHLQAMAYRFLGNCYNSKFDWWTAKTYFEKCIEINPKDTESLLKLGEYYCLWHGMLSENESYTEKTKRKAQALKFLTSLEQMGASSQFNQLKELIDSSFEY